MFLRGFLIFLGPNGSVPVGCFLNLRFIFSVSRMSLGPSIQITPLRGKFFVMVWPKVSSKLVNSSKNSLTLKSFLFSRPRPTLNVLIGCFTLRVECS